MINLDRYDNVFYVLTKRINIDDDEKTLHEENVIKQLILNLNHHNNIFYMSTKRAE